MRITLLALLALPALAFAQGQLTPPDGAIGDRGPVPTMKTLNQIEPRNPVRSGGFGVADQGNGGFLITSSGSFYLEGNLLVGSGNAITITVPDVTLDLNGFNIISVAGDAVDRGIGIEISTGVNNVTIRNGHIRGTSTYEQGTFTAGGFNYGISAPGSSNHNVLVEDVGVVGVVQFGIALPANSTVVRCAVSVSGFGGIFADVVRDCTARDCLFGAINAKTAENCVAAGTGIGISAETAINCRGECTASLPGIQASKSATNCYGLSATGTGLSAGQALNSKGESTDGTGLAATVATNCEGQSTKYLGLSATSATGCYGYSDSGIGLDTTTAINCFGRSSSSTGLIARETATACRGSTGSGGYGIYAMETADNCYGVVTLGTGIGIKADTANNCRGSSINGAAVSAVTATGCHGKATGSGAGVTTSIATSSFGESSSGVGLQATQAASGSAGITTSGPCGLLIGLDPANYVTTRTGAADNCRGESSGSGPGLVALTANNCIGRSTSGYGIYTDLASDSRGQCDGSAYGIYADSNVLNCRGQSQTGTGIMAMGSATNCTGVSTTGYWGMYIFGTANSCRGRSGASGGTAIWATIAVACTSEGGVITGNKQLGTP